MNNNEKEKFILYGASFNPPHMGHFSAISQMLEDYDKVIIFPYPKKYNSDGKIEDLPSITQRMKMLKIFFAEYFPQMSEKLILTDLASEIIKSKIVTGMPHTYDYLKYAQTKIQNNISLSVCLGFEASNELRTETFSNEETIKNDFGVFRLEEENTIKSSDLRKFFSSNKNIKSAKHEQYIKYAVGNSLADYIFKNNLYGIKNRKDDKLITQTKKNKLY